MDNLDLSSWLSNAFSKGFNNLDQNGKVIWDEFSAAIPAYEFAGGWQSDFAAIYAEMKEVGALDKEECPPHLLSRHHHFIQLARIPKNKPATLQSLCQIMFNLGRFEALDAQEPYPAQWTQLIKKYQLNDCKAYVIIKN